MTLAEAISSFLRHTAEKESCAENSPESPSEAPPLVRSLELLTDHFSSHSRLESMTPEQLRDLLSRCYVESAASSSAPGPRALLDALSRFFTWAGTDADNQCLAVIKELEQSLPRAFEISERLSKEIAGHGGAISFPEFLTSFEGGGQSQYDLDSPGEVGAIDGYFRITRVEATLVEAVELISEARVWPILFPEEVASLICAGFIINLELVRTLQGWQIAACGFAYPPGAQV
jgi:hypothetical protein